MFWCFLSFSSSLSYQSIYNILASLLSASIPSYSHRTSHGRPLRQFLQGILQLLSFLDIKPSSSSSPTSTPTSSCTVLSHLQLLHPLQLQLQLPPQQPPQQPQQPPSISTTLPSHKRGPSPS
ncbi:hypothetical protein HPP92_020068 [Vanilla planifolia]|uniref:Uncharacterized protein n=1 Tax=Vanilla planifolia TaxID=51239 RepID=A0A835Q588_VANPL|nr:hypothetical protein HPP92_020068 [Vanilla planifolia]